MFTRICAVHEEMSIPGSRSIQCQPSSRLILEFRDFYIRDAEAVIPAVALTDKNTLPELALRMPRDLALASLIDRARHLGLAGQG
ncbi:MAG: hypothetical protein NZ914_13995 [Gemmatales bacterium]|nr:hypothetical protein [Gemmatales bacterium]